MIVEHLNYFFRFSSVKKLIIEQCERKWLCMRFTINEIKNKTNPIAKAYGIGRMSLFGSYARGEATDDSDVDLYIERGKLKSLLQYFAFIDELENALDCHVDVVTTGIEDKTFLSKIMQEGVLLYEE